MKNTVITPLTVIPARRVSYRKNMLLSDAITQAGQRSCLLYGHGTWRMTNPAKLVGTAWR
jgi:hypothetical protein